MKTLALTALVGLGLSLSFADAAAVPGRMSFTGRLSTSNGPVTGSVNITFTIYDAASGGASRWSEDHPGVAANAGLVHASLGSLTTLDASVVDGGALFLEVTVSGETLSPRLPLHAVPYAIRAAVADDADRATTADTLGTITPAQVVTAVTATGSVTATRSGNTVTLTGATPTSACVNATAAGTIAAASSGTTTATCAAGYLLTSGGCATGTGPLASFRILYQSYPSGVAAWTCSWNNTHTSLSPGVTAYARCCRLE